MRKRPFQCEGKPRSGEPPLWSGLPIDRLEVKGGGTQSREAGVARNLPRFSLNGCGTLDENWDNRSLHLSCARPNLLPRMRPKLQQRRLPRSRMAHRNGRAHRLRMGFLAPRLRRNPMEASVALPTIRSISKSDAPSTMAPYDSCMPHALVIVVPARGAHSVRRQDRHGRKTAWSRSFTTK